METKKIGSKITEARKKMGLSQAQLAERLFISSQAVGKWERGESMPDITTLNRLAEIFELDLNYFSDKFKSIESQVTKSEKPERQIIEVPISQPKKKFDWNWDMSHGNWVDADFSGLKNLKEKFNGSNIKNCKFLGSELSELIMKGNNIENSDFSGSDLRNSKIQTSHVSKNTFVNCSLIDTEFSASEINNCNFSNADFSGAEFSTSEFRNNIIEKAVWKFTAFKSSAFAEIVFDGTLEDCVFENCGFSKVTFQNAIFKNTFFKHNRNLKRIKFINCQADKLTYAFLKSGKADLSGLTIILE